jgi:DNA-binding GntR family transcriptional regulator
MLATMREHGPEGVSERAAAHSKFHATLAELSGNKYVIGQIPMIRLTAQMLARRLRSLAVAMPKDSAEMVEEGEDDHMGVLDAIEAGDGRQAEAIARRHIRKTMRSSLLRP